LFSYL